MTAPVAAAQRFAKAHPCPVCGGHNALPQGRGVRCYGFLSADGLYAHCVRPEHAGRIEPDAAGTYAHWLTGDCRCGGRHEVAAAPSSTGSRPKAQRETRYEVRDADGQLQAVHVRHDKRDGSKAFAWELPDGTKNLGGRRVETLPLYGSERLWELPDGAAIVLTEGERTCEALRARGVAAVGTVTGASGTPGDDALSPLLRLRPILWPDNDEPGSEHMRRIAARLSALGARASTVRWPDAPPKGDAADAVTLGVDVQALIEGADPWEAEQNAGGAIVFPPAAPMKNAGLFVSARFAHSQRPLLISQGNTFFGWNGASWPEIEEATLRSQLYAFFRDAQYLSGEDVKTFDPTRHKVRDLLDALGAVAHLPASVSPPTWLNGDGPVPASEIVACTNGLVHVPTRTLRPLTPTFYAHHAVPFAYDPQSPAPTRWLQFLNDLWPDDAEPSAVLQEVFGYILSGDTSLQKIFGLIGPKRSGKGTIGRVLTAMVGRHHVAGPTLAGIGTNFGLSPLIGKPVAIISDARLRDGDALITERLLTISGEDAITIDRKYREPWTGKLPSRLVILSNELPRLTDSSGALASRFVLLMLTRSFYGKENPKLTDELIEELPGIFNWSLDGLQRLRDRGYFQQPKSSTDALRDLEDLGSPVSAFLREWCTAGPGHAVAVDTLYGAWRDWCAAHGRDRPGTAQTFGRDLRAAFPGIKVTQPRDGAARQRRYEGVGLKELTNDASARVPVRADSRYSDLARTGTRATPMYSDMEEGEL